MSYRRRFNLDEVLREWAAEQVATNRDQRDLRRSGEEMAAATDGAAEEDEVRTRSIKEKPSVIFWVFMLRSSIQNSSKTDLDLMKQHAMLVFTKYFPEC